MSREQQYNPWHQSLIWTLIKQSGILRDIKYIIKKTEGS